MVLSYEENTLIQLKLFDPQTIRYAYLIADSPRQAFYKIWLESCSGCHRVRKESGIKDKVLNSRAWNFESLKKAEKYFNRRVQDKTNPNRQSLRKYQIKEQSIHFL